jgi:anti-sigma regulatory factor (Ser/Thr protein kinase)
MGQTAFINEDTARREASHEAFACGVCAEGHARANRAVQTEKSAAQISAKSFTPVAVRALATDALAACPVAGIEVISALPEWVELRVPCDLAATPAIEKLLARLDADLPQEINEAINYAFREMLGNAVEYGCRLDPSEHIEVRFVRLKRAFICRIKDPGAGFDPARLEHAAVSNPEDDPLRHASVRDERGLRAGGFGILLASRLVDELVYNERHNELMFVKYLT